MRGRLSLSQAGSAEQGLGPAAFAHEKSLVEVPGPRCGLAASSHATEDSRYLGAGESGIRGASLWSAYTGNRERAAPTEMHSKGRPASQPAPLFCSTAGLSATSAGAGTRVRVGQGKMAHDCLLLGPFSVLLHSTPSVGDAGIDLAAGLSGHERVSGNWTLQAARLIGPSCA